MSKHSITLGRTLIGRTYSSRIGTDALNALSSIPGVVGVEIAQESDEQVELAYDWTGAEQFLEVNEHLAQFGLQRI